MKRSHILLHKCFREKYMRLAVSLVVCLLFAVTFLSQSYQATREFQRKSIYGYHNGCAFHISNASEQAFMSHRALNNYGEMLIFGSVLSGDGFSVGYIGTVDENFRSLEQLSFLEGTYPQQENEIAVEYAMLDLLHIPYEMGEEIKLQIQVDEETVCERTYRLCGILKTYTTNWKSDGYALCGAIVTEFPGEIIQRHLFFSSEYENEQQMQELVSLVGDPEKSAVVYNDYSYPSDLLTVSQIVENGGTILAIAAFCCLFLVCIQISAYRSQLYRMRVLLTLGADRKELKRMLYEQALSQWAKCYLLCILLCSFVCGILVVIPQEVARFRLSPLPYLLSGVLSLLIILIGKAVQLSMLHRVSIIPKGRDLTRYEGSASVKRGPSSPLNGKNFIRIETHRNRKYFRIELALGLLSLAILFFCLYGICDSYSDYKVVMDLANFDYSWESSSPTIGLSKTAISQVKNTANIDNVVYSSLAYSMKDNNIYLYYAEQMYDEYRKCLNIQKSETNPNVGLMVCIVMIPEDSPMWDYYIPDELDEEAFLLGNQVIAFLPELMKTEYGYIPVNTFGINTQEIYGQTYLPQISPGEQVTLKMGDQERDVTCGYIMREFPNQAQTTLDFFSPGTILVSEVLFQELFNLDEPIYNYVLAFGNNKLSYDVGDKIMSALSRNPNITFTNHRIEKETSYTLFRTEVLSLGSISAFVCILAVIIIYRNRMYLFEVERDRINLLRRLGCGGKMLSKMYKRSFGTVLIPIAIVLNAIAIPALFYHKFAAYFAAESAVDMWSLVLMRALYQFPLPLLILTQAIYLTVFASVLWHSYTKTVKA